ncbi:hypothetical protein WA026_017404 [Henosepilachna vigintioctopunctata]|uniref:Endonuclease/exonuclease/phosphatase domain-containing protein n=1 Tax=Henosepilachna vigintioctopunctata TaxID=420089 RepID=A0AAW1VHN3_9CUCU
MCISSICTKYGYSGLLTPEVFEFFFIFGIMSWSKYIYSTYDAGVNIVITGDFNVDLNARNASSLDILNLFGSFGLHRTIHTYTRKHYTGRESCIDNIFTYIQDLTFPRIKF